MRMRVLLSGNKLTKIMSDKEEVTLEGQAVTEILKEVKRSKELAKDFGALAWQKQKKPLPNKRFLNNTLVSTLRHSYREERKHRDGSYKKYKQHMQNKHFYKHKNQVNEEEMEPEQPSENIDYGEFDAAKYAETCTELYIRDSHRKHSRIRQNFVEKQNDGSSSDDSFTVEDDEEKDGSPESFHANNKRSRRHWSESGSTDNDQAFTSDSNSIYKRGARQTRYPVQPSGSRHRHNWSDFPKSHHNARQTKLKHDLAMFESETESDEEDEESVESDSESKTETTSKTQSRKRKRIPNDGKSLLEKLSQRSMYADIEEIKKSHNYVSNSDEEDFERNKVCGFEMKHSQRPHKDFSEKKPQIIPHKKNTEDKRLRRSKFIEKRMNDASDSEAHERIFHESYKTSKPEHQRAYDNSYYKRPQPYRYNMERRGYQTYRGRYHRQHMYPPMPLNPFYASFLMEQMKEFLMHHQDYRKRSRSRSHGRKSRKKRKYHRHRHQSRSTSSESRSYSRSRSRSKRRSRDRSKSHTRSNSSRRKSRSKSDSRSRSRSRRRSQTWSKSSSRSKSRKRSRHKSRSRSRKRSERRSRSKSRSRSRSKSRSRSRSKSRGRSRSKSRKRTKSKSRRRSRSKSRSRSRSWSRSSSRSRSRSRSEHKQRKRSESDSRSRSRKRSKSDSRSRLRKRSKRRSNSWSRSSSTNSMVHAVKDEKSLDNHKSLARNNLSTYNESSRSPSIQNKQTDPQHNDIPRQKSYSEKNHHRKSSKRIKGKHNSSHKSKNQDSKSSSLKSEDNLVHLKLSSRIDEEKIHSNSDGEVIEETDSIVTNADISKGERDVNKLQEKNECLLKLKSRKSQKTSKGNIDISKTSEVDNGEEKPLSDSIVCGEDGIDKSDTDPSGLESLTPEENNTDEET